MFAKFGALFTRVTDWSASRGHLVFAFYFTLYGSLLQWFHRLDFNYIMLIAAIQAFLLGHQVKDSYFDFKSNDTKPPTAT